METDSGRPSHALGVSPAGTVVTPNYLDNVSARVAPWCGCEASGNRREECEAFRKLFTRNPCLGEGPGDPGEPRMSVAQSKLPGPWVLFTWCGQWTVCTCHGAWVEVRGQYIRVSLSTMWGPRIALGSSVLVAC